MASLFVIAQAPASCGELVQGIFNGENFHISCPVSLYSRVKVTLNAEGRIVGPSSRWKTKETIKRTLSFFSEESLGVNFKINSKIPLGKGMASSTADIGAASLAIARVLKKKISPQEIAKIALSIEPTDGTLFNGIVIFDHRKGALFKFLGKVPDMEIFVIDLGGRVDTLEFNKKVSTKINQKREGEIREALKLVEKGIKGRDPGLIAKGATISAFSNQKILYKPDLDKIWKISQAAGALGVNVAHSGTVVGVLAKPNRVNFKELKDSLQDREIGEVFYKTKIVNEVLQCISTVEM